jgi:hypothetical protein
MEWIVASRRGKYLAESKEAAVRKVIDNSRTIAPIAAVPATGITAARGGTSWIDFGRYRSVAGSRNAIRVIEVLVTHRGPFAIARHRAATTPQD